MKERLYKRIRGQEILTLSEDKSEPLIEDFLFENDYVLIVAEEKAGKTILAQQIACSLTSGTPFLGTLDVTKPVNVWYFSTEGKEEDLKDRFIRMSHGVKLDADRLTLIPSFFHFNTDTGRKCLRDILSENKDNLPKVVIIDALYQAVKGSIKSDSEINEFHHIIRWMMHECDCAVIVIHHFRKKTRGEDGAFIQRTDDDVYGSAFLKAAADHCFWMEKSKKNPKDIVLRCDTQRSGNIIDNVRLHLRQPDPLFFETASHLAEERLKIENFFEEKGNGSQCPMTEIIEETKLGKSTCYKAVNEMTKDGLLVRTKGKPRLYSLSKPYGERKGS